MELDNSLSCSQQPAISPNFKLAEPSKRPSSFRKPLVSSYHLHLVLAKCHPAFRFFYRCTVHSVVSLNTPTHAYIYLFIHNLRSLKFTLKHLKRSYMFRSHDHPQGAYFVPC